MSICTSFSRMPPRSICRAGCSSTQRERGSPATYHVRHSGKRLEVAALDLSGTLDALLERVGCLARRVKALRNEVLSLSHAAWPGSGQP